ncbi:preprotein translocase subunit TatC [Thalassobaculum fulvum]|uniref:Preprotein translocase subunit TatC n=1 Tax=Thalassobaculum fulvum TaxID=1633335 RepID=A0A918XMZ4_9PROT|nr:group III truncated hemoglobin [Thalassobaculum fulvum]GHD39067.1 preprotein translocase subunit TatC [Thalassobaculum fulvum]
MREPIMTAYAEPDTVVTEAEIEHTVALFYGRAREDALLGPVFRGAVPDAEWDAHLAKIAAFWRKVLRRQPGYEGNPMRAHVALGVLEKRHFDRWLALFEAAAREVCRPEAAEIFVERARLIAASLLHGLEFFRNREQAAG